MASQNGNGSGNPGAADVFGGKMFDVVTYSGPQSYNNGVGDVLDHRMFGFENKILVAAPLGISVSGTYYGLAQPADVGLTSWHLRWFVLSTNEEVAGGQNLSAENLQLLGLGI